MRRYFILTLLAALALVGTSATTAHAQTSCATEGGVRWCNTVSTTYPNTTGWYGYVGLGGGPCNSNPRGTTFPDGVMGVCVVPAPEVVWKWTSAGWSRSSLAVGTRAYVHPYTKEWRWIWVDGSWYAIDARRLTLEWRA
jgi:hypothetical protein